jgi:peptidoglycan/LPS O-acetylase OafA/YrhL
VSKALSVYLDLLRFLAAVVVFLHHLPRVTGGGYELASEYGEDAVMVFFVLSGFVIAHVVDTKERDVQSYAASRLARLYSVAIPALALTLLFDFIGRSADPSLYGGWYGSDWPLIRLGASLSFTNQLWSLDIRPFGNPPYWSISYEFWYYVLFAILVFARSKWLIALWALIVGPPILLLLPVWMAGVWVYRRSATFRVSRSLAWAMAVVPILIYVAYHAIGARETLTGLTDPLVALTGDPWFLHKARFFLHDYAVAAMLCVHFLGVVVLFRDRQWTVGKNSIRKLASYTFSLYLLHHPLIYCLAAVTPWTGWWQDALIFVGVAACVWLVGDLCESKKDGLRAMILRWITSATRREVAY